MSPLFFVHPSKKQQISPRKLRVPIVGKLVTFFHQPTDTCTQICTRMFVSSHFTLTANFCFRTEISTEPKKMGLQSRMQDSKWQQKAYVASARVRMVGCSSHLRISAEGVSRGFPARLPPTFCQTKNHVRRIVALLSTSYFLTMKKDYFYSLFAA